MYILDIEYIQNVIFFRIQCVNIAFRGYGHTFLMKCSRIIIVISFVL